MPEPYLDARMRTWIASTARRNHWRVAAWYGLDDLIQDGYICYAKCRNKYTELTVKQHPEAEDRRRFMALVKAAFINHIHDLAKDKTACSEIAISQTGLTPHEVDLLLPLEQAPQPLQLSLRRLPTELWQLLELFNNDAIRLRQRLSETRDKHYCRRLKLDPKAVDLGQLVRDHLGDMLARRFQL